MAINILIPAADELYTHSPARCVTAQRDTLVVRGERGNEWADALFSLLFTTAYHPGIKLRLVRLVPSGAKEAEGEFLSRNRDGISAFMQHGPLGVLFLNEAEFDADKEKERIAWESGPEGKALSGFPAPGDEERYPVVRIARRVHKAYTATWNSRYTEEEISGDLYGTKEKPAEENGWYCLRSSLRLAVSIPWKLAAAGIPAEGHVPEALWRKLNGAGGLARDRLAWQEHRSWQAFMALDGWRMPTAEEMDAYFFRDGNDHRNKKEKWHPCLCDLEEDDWNEPHERSLKDTPIHQWSRVQENPDGYCRMDRMSLEIHHRCKEWVVSAEFTERMDSLFRELEIALVSIRAENDEKLTGLARRMENMFRRLQDNETNSFAPWQQACEGFREALGDAWGGEIREVYRNIMAEAAPAVERNRYRNYKEIDTEIIDWLPWILTEEKIGTVWKLYAAGSPLDNLLSAVILRPENLVILCTEEETEEIQLDVFREFLDHHGTGDTQVRTELVSSLAGETVPAGPRDAVDVTGSGERQNLLQFPDGARIICFANGDLQDRKGAPFFAPVYHPYDFALTVKEVLMLRGRDDLSDGRDNEMLGMEEEYLPLWKARMKAANEDTRIWRAAVLALQAAEKVNRRQVWRKWDSRSRFYTHGFPPEQYERLLKTGAVDTLRELEQAGCIGLLTIDSAQGMVSCYIYPAREETEQYEETEDVLSRMLDDTREDSRYAFVSEYTQADKPCCFENLSDPVRLDLKWLAGEVRKEELKNCKDRWERDGLPDEDGYAKVIDKGLSILKREGLLVKAGGVNLYRFRSLQVRRELEKEGFALEAFVYYTLFLSGEFDDVRNNVRIANGIGVMGGGLEDELDVLVTRKGRVGLISCKDTLRFDEKHIAKTRMEADLYAINAKPILVCSRKLPPDLEKMCRYLKVTPIWFVNKGLPAKVIKEMETGGN